MTLTTQTRFDLDAYLRAIEANDLPAQSSLFDDDAEFTLVDQQHPPRSPLVRRGREAITRALAEKDPGLTHRIEQHVLGDERAAYTERCRYPEGQEVLCHVMLEFRHGKIARAQCVQAYDE